MVEGDSPLALDQVDLVSASWCERDSVVTTLHEQLATIRNKLLFPEDPSKAEMRIEETTGNNYYQLGYNCLNDVYAKQEEEDIWKY